MDSTLKGGIFATVFTALAFGLPAIGSASTVTLQSSDGIISLNGTLLEDDGDIYVIQTGLGVMRVEKSLVECSGDGCPVPPAPEPVVVEAPAAPQPAPAIISTSASSNEPVTLSSADGVIALSGTLLEFEGDSYVIETQLGTMRIAKNLVECTGDGCPVTAVPSIFVRGSSTIGDELMPLLVRGYSSEAGGTVTAREQITDDTARLTIAPSQGSGTSFNVEYQSAGTTAGMRSLIAGDTDIAMASRSALIDERSALLTQGRGDLNSIDQDYVVAVDSILTIVNPANNIDALSMGQLAGIFSGAISNWSAVGGPDLPINVYTKDQNSGTRAVFTTKVLTPEGAVMRADSVEVKDGPDMAQRVENDPAGIGYIDFARQGGTKSLDLIASCGIRMSANEFSSKTEEYPLERRLRLYVDNQPMTPEAQGLLNFAISPAADPLIRDAGFIDLSVKIASRKDTSQRQLADSDAQLGRTELEMVGQMLQTLDGAERLSTTLRFEPNSVTLDNKSKRDILRLLQFMSEPEMAGRQLILAGFSDSTGPFDQNAALSLRRAAAATAAVESHPLASTLQSVSFVPAGFSELSPVGCNTTEDGRQRNRRVELWLK